MRVFIIRPFQIKRGIDFERVQRDLIDPILADLKIAGGTTGEILEAGNIREDMFQHLVTADLVIADISLNNPNVFYELGIRHGVREKRTFLLRAKTMMPGVERAPEDEVPFDLRTDRYLLYDPADPAGTRSTFLQALQQTLASDRHDSPVFAALPALEPPPPSHLLAVPPDFYEDMDCAVDAKRKDLVSLMGFEVCGLPWESEGLRVVGHAQIRLKEFQGASFTWEALRHLHPDDVEASLMLATVYQRLGDFTKSTHAAQRVLRLPTSTAKGRAEARGLLGRNKKVEWQTAWRDVPGQQRRAAAFASPLLMDAYEEYYQAYEQDLNHYYPGLNALGLLTILLDLALAFPEQWSGRFASDTEAKVRLQDLKRQRDQLSAGVELGLDVAERKEKLKNEKDQDPWVKTSLADLLLLTSKRPAQVAFAYQQAIAKIPPFNHASIRQQIQLFADLNVLKANASKALQVFGSPFEAPRTLERVILFTGHRIDGPGRTPARFPERCEFAARAAIRGVLEQEKTHATGPLLGLSGGASGGDILFLEVCRELGIATRLCLALPEDAFLSASVSPSGPKWVERFHLSKKAADAVVVMAENQTLPRWLQRRRDYGAWQRNNLWLLSQAVTTGAQHMTILALWDGEEGDGPGGTKHLVQLATEQHAKVEILRTKEIFRDCL
ncbi:tetratricopeptide repeat-containing protein [Nitrospira sp. Nam74]